MLLKFNLEKEKNSHDKLSEKLTSLEVLILLSCLFLISIVCVGFIYYLNKS